MNRATFILILTFAATLARADEQLPATFKFDRYQKMLDHSPFAVASAVVAPAAAPDFAKGLYVANAAKTPEADLVTIMSTDDRNLKEYLTTGGPNEHGYGIANIEWSERPGETKVTISKDGKFASLTFNQALMTASAPNQGTPGVPQPPLGPPQPGQLPQPPQPLQPPQPISQPGFPKPTPAAGAGRPTPHSPSPHGSPHTRGVIPRKPGGPGARRDE